MKKEGPIRYSRVQVHRRCKKLAEKELVKDLGNGVYMITDDGEAYLNGRLDTETWTYIDDNSEAVEAQESADGEASNEGAT
jgi:predicted transcriptional regulator